MKIDYSIYFTPINIEDFNDRYGTDLYPSDTLREAERQLFRADTDYLRASFDPEEVLETVCTYEYEAYWSVADTPDIELLCIEPMYLYIAIIKD